MNRYSLLKIVLVIPIAYFFFWAIFHEIIIWQKPVLTALVDSYQNWAALIVFIVLEAVIVFKEHTLNRTNMATQHEMEKDNPWAQRKTVKKGSKDSFRYFMRSSTSRYKDKVEGAFDAIWASRIHRHIFFKVKRFIFGCLALLYFVLALISVANPFFAVVFLITAYAFIENLLLAKHYQFIKRRTNDDESTQT